ncbi:MAG: M48 family metalloprotease [Gammaproteobacteria bacterium]|nr:M48 family metalloprotease [Gammaproteobacteria bacterium]
MRRLVKLALLAASLHVAAGPGPGEKMYLEALDKGFVYDDESWQTYVQEIGERVLAYTPHWNRKYHFYVIDDSEINASATRDGYIDINRGILVYMSSEDELAALIGHEIAHVTARHHREFRNRRLLGKSLGLVSWLATGVGDLMGVADTATAQQALKFKVEQELEADRLGGEYMAKAGYNPLAIIDMLQVLKEDDIFATQVEKRPTIYHGLYRTHPKNDKRLHDTVAFAQQSFNASQTVEPLRDFWEMIDGMVYGDQGANGVVRDTIFYHGALRLVVEFPDDWTVAKLQTEVSGTAPGGTAEAFISLGYHVIDGRLSPLEFLTETLKRDDIKSGEPVEINGFDAYIGEVDNEGTDAKVKLIGVLFRGRSAYLFSGEAGPDGDADAFRKDFIATIHSVRNMTADDAKIANKLRIRVRIAEPDVTYADLARRSPIERHAEEQLRLLNAGYPNGEPRAGNYIKVVE